MNIQGSTKISPRLNLFWMSFESLSNLLTEELTKDRLDHKGITLIIQSLIETSSKLGDLTPKHHWRKG
jgi:hypothetical protein